MSRVMTRPVRAESLPWNSESGEDDGDGSRCEDEVEDVILSTSTAGGSVKSIFLLPVYCRVFHSVGVLSCVSCVCTKFHMSTLTYV